MILIMLASRKRPKLAVNAGHVLFDESLARLHFLTSQQIHRAWILFQRRAASGWSFTDCASKCCIDDLKIATAAALDQHFRQFGVNVVL